MWDITKGHNTWTETNTQKKREVFYSSTLRYLISEISEDLLRMEKKKNRLIAGRGKSHRGTILEKKEEEKRREKRWPET